MYLKTGLLILLLLPSLQRKPPEPRSAVSGQWQLDKIRSPEERADNIVWTLQVTKNQFIWDTEVTNGEKTTLGKHIYKLGESDGRYDGGRRWFFNVEYDDHRLLIKRRFHFPSEALQPWTDFYFEVKDHGHTLYFKQRWNKDVAILERVLYFRPVKEKKD